MANWTDSCARHGAHPPALDTLNTILRKPLNRHLPHIALLIGVSIGLLIGVSIGRGSRRKPRPRRLFLGIDHHEAIVKSDIGDDGDERGLLDRLEAGPILFKDCCIPTVEGAEK